MTQAVRTETHPTYGLLIHVEGLPGPTDLWNLSDLLAQEWGYASFVDDPALPMRRAENNNAADRIIPEGSLVLPRPPEPGWDHAHCDVESCWQEISRNPEYGQPAAWHAQRHDMWICCSCHDALMKHRDRIIAVLREYKQVILAEHRTFGVPIEPGEYWLL